MIAKFGKWYLWANIAGLSLVALLSGLTGFAYLAHWVIKTLFP